MNRANFSVSIVGYGVVGQAVGKLFPVAKLYDSAPGWGGVRQKQAINQSDFAFICVPTPTRSDEPGRADTSAVVEVVGWIEAKIIIIRSTVPPGTTAKLRTCTGKRIIFQPEYLGETPGHPFADLRSQTWSVLGGPREDTAAVAELYMTVYPATHRFVFVDATAAELAKYMENAWLATKATFCNEWFDVAAAFGADWHQLREAWLADPRIHADHTAVYSSARGWGGKCLPKDVAAMIAACKAQGVDPALLRAVEAVNALQRSGQREQPPEKQRVSS